MTRSMQMARCYLGHRRDDLEMGIGSEAEAGLLA